MNEEWLRIKNFIFNIKYCFFLNKDFSFTMQSMQFFVSIFCSEITVKLCLCESKYCNIFQDNNQFKGATLRCTNISHYKSLRIGNYLFKDRHPSINNIWGEYSSGFIADFRWLFSSWVHQIPWKRTIKKCIC